MSAFMVDQKHIDGLVNVAIGGPAGIPVQPGRGWFRPFSYYYGNERHQVVYETADQVGQMLAHENARSIRARYEDADTYLPDWVDSGYAFSWPHRKMTAVEALKAISCFDYQSCETKDWRESEAYAFCQALKDHLIGQLDGYDDAPWEWIAS